MSSTYQQYIGGTWRDAASKKTWDVVNPATEETIVTVPFGDGEDCREAIQAAAEAFPAWSRKTAYERAPYLRGASDRIRELLRGCLRVGQEARL